MRVTSILWAQAVSVASRLGYGGWRGPGSRLSSLLQAVRTATCIEGSRLSSLLRRRVVGRCRAHPYASPRQQGAALVMGMVMLALLSMLGLAAFGTGVMEQRMAANARDRIRAFQAAEAALRLCESAIDPDTSVFNSTGGDGGMYDTSMPARWNAGWAGWASSAPTVRVYAGMPLVDSQPACIAERLTPVINETPGAAESLRMGLPVETARTYRHYRVTARGVGISDRTVVILQSHLRLRTD